MTEIKIVVTMEWKTGHAVILFLVSMTTGISSLPYHWSILDIDVNYYDLVKLNVTCGDLHSCNMRGNSSTDDLRYVNCHCGPACTQLGTCCVDSEYRTSQTDHDTSGVECRSVNGHSLFEIAECRNDWEGEDFVRDLCVGDAAAMNDPLLLVPVSSSQSGITYRNYFCFVCNVDVDADKPVFWNVKLMSDSENVSRHSLPDLEFKETIWAWTVRNTNNTVFISFEMTDELRSLVKWCRQGFTIKSCSEYWTDVLTKVNCEAYMAEIWIRRKIGFQTSTMIRYQNPHCAICNFEEVSDSFCAVQQIYSTAYGAPAGIPGVPFVGLFSFDKKTIRCPRNTILDTFKNKCRTFRCGRNSDMVDGKCVAKRL